MLLPLASLAIVFAPPPAATTVCASCVKAHVERLAAPDLNGRRCSTADEAKAADYLAGELSSAGVKGGLEGGGYIQTVPLLTEHAAGPASMMVGDRTLVQGKDFEVQFGLKPLSGRVVRITDAATPGADLKDAVVFYDPPTGAGSIPPSLRGSGARAVIAVWPNSPGEPLSGVASVNVSRWIEGDAPRVRQGAAQMFIRPEAADALRATPAGATLELKTAPGEPTHGTTHNVVAVIHGSAPDADHNAALLTAHYDHLGFMMGKLYPGANDDASGTAAVLEFARILKTGAKPARTVVFALFGCEEAGGFGATWFDRHPALPLTDLKANIEFEMIGFRDPQHPKLMMTGYERSNLGPTLAAHGANIEQDPYPAQNFFQRSDNYALAKVGVVAHTISAWPTPPTYHQPTDTAASVDFPFMAASIQSLVGPVRWLLNSDFAPAWNPSGKP